MYAFIHSPLLKWTNGIHNAKAFALCYIVYYLHYPYVIFFYLYYDIIKKRYSISSI